MPTIGRLRGDPPWDPKNLASPYPKIPPSEATNQYPLPEGVAGHANNRLVQR